MASAALAALSSWAWPVAEAPKAPPRTKLAATYEALLGGAAVAGHTPCLPCDVLRDDWAPPRFWDEMLLLKVDAQFLLRALGERTPEQLLAAAAPLSELTCVCVRYLEDRNLLRIAHALETLTLIFSALSRKRFPNRGLDLLTVAAGGEANARALFSRLIPAAAGLAERDDAALVVRSAALRLLCTLASASPNVNANVLAAFLMERDVYDPMLRLLSLRPSATDGGAEALRPHAAALLALLLTWRESRNAYAQRLATASPAQLCTLLAACARLLSPPPAAAASAVDAAAAAASASAHAAASATAEPAQSYASSLLTDAAAAAGWAAEAVFAAAWSTEALPEREGLLDAMAASLGYARRDATQPLTWQAAPPAVAGAVLLAELAQHSPLLRIDAAWISASSALRGAASVGPLWHECLGRLLVHAAQLARATGTGAGGYGAALAPALLLQHLSTLRLLVEDPKSADFAAGTDVGRLRGSAGAPGGDAPDAGAALGGGAGGTALLPPRSVAAAVLELCAEVMLRGAASENAVATASSAEGASLSATVPAAPVLHFATSACDSAAAEGLACYLAHRLLHAHGARGGAPLPLRAGWGSLWRAAAAALRRCARPGALQRPRVARLTAQLLNLLAFALAGGAHLTGPATEHARALLDAVAATRADVLRLGEAALQAGLLDPADATSLAPPDAVPWLGPPSDASPTHQASFGDVGATEGDPSAEGHAHPHRPHALAFRPAPRASAASLPAAALPPLRLRPLLDVFAAAADARHVAPALPRVTLERLDAAFAAGGAPTEAGLAAAAALSRALVAAAAPEPAALLAATGALDAQLSGARQATTTA